jgi:hypothetical protein
MSIETMKEAMDALRAAIEQTEKQEPVAFMYTNARGLTVIVKTNTSPFEDAIPLYTHPPRREWQGLTEEEIIIMSRYNLEYAALIGEVQGKLKDKNT